MKGATGLQSWTERLTRLRSVPLVLCGNEKTPPSGEVYNLRSCALLPLLTDYIEKFVTKSRLSSFLKNSFLSGFVHLKPGISHQYAGINKRLGYHQLLTHFSLRAFEPAGYR